MGIRYDSRNNLGKVVLDTSPYASADTLKIEGQTIKGYNVDLVPTEAAAGLTSAVFKLQGSNDNSAWTDLAASPSFTAAEICIQSGKPLCSIAVPDTAEEYTYFRILGVPTGTATAGEVDCLLNCYIGVR